MDTSNTKKDQKITNIRVGKYVISDENIYGCRLYLSINNGEGIGINSEMEKRFEAVIDKFFMKHF